MACCLPDPPCRGTKDFDWGIAWAHSYRRVSAMMLIPGNEKKIVLSLTMPPSIFCIHHRTMIFKMGLTNTGYGNSTFIMYYERRHNEFGLEFSMDDLNQGEHVELDSTHLGGSTEYVWVSLCPWACQAGQEFDPVFVSFFSPLICCTHLPTAQ